MTYNRIFTCFAGVLTLLLMLALTQAIAQPTIRLKKKDLKKDLEMITTEGRILLRLSDQTPIHRDNFLKLAKSGFYDDILFHRVIRGFMVQAGNPSTKRDSLQARDTVRNRNYTLPAEFRAELFHRRGALAAARTGDEVNPLKASSGFQFYIVQGRVFTENSLDSVETFRLKGRKLPAAHREVYKQVGGSPHLDQHYTVFGEVVEGMETVDRIAAQPTTGPGKGDRPIKEIRITSVRLVKRKRQN